MSEFQNEITQVLQESGEVIKQEVIKNLQNTVINNLTYGLKDKTTDIMKEFLEEHLKEEIKLILIEHKGEMLEEIKKGIIGAIGELAKGMTVKAETNLNKIWNFEAIIKNLFNV